MKTTRQERLFIAEVSRLIEQIESLEIETDRKETLDWLLLKCREFVKEKPDGWQFRLVLAIGQCVIIVGSPKPKFELGGVVRQGSEQIAAESLINRYTPDQFNNDDCLENKKPAKS